MQCPIVHKLQRFPRGVGTYTTCRDVACVGWNVLWQLWWRVTIWLPTRNRIFLFTDPLQNICCPQYPVLLIWTLCPGLNQLHTSLRPLANSWMRGVLSSRWLYFTVWYWEIFFFSYCSDWSGYSNQVGCVWCYNVPGNSVNRGTAHFLIWVFKFGGDCHFSVVQFNTMQHDAV